MLSTTPFLATLLLSLTSAALATPARSSIPNVFSRQSAHYAQGTCHIHVYQDQDPYETPDDNDSDSMYDYHVSLIMYDNSGTQIGCMEQAGCDANYPCQTGSLLENYLLMVPEQEHDYIQFELGAQSWTSNNEEATVSGTYCDVGGWDNDDGHL